MMHLVERKYEIENKLKNEVSRIQTLRNAARKSSELSNDICNVLGACEQRLEQLEGAVLPLYGDTAKLQKIHKNIEKSMQSLDHVISFYMISRDLADLISAGPDTSSPEAIKPYLDALDNLTKAQNYFNNNNPHSVELENINTLYNNGVAKLESVFEDILSRHSRPMSPASLLDMIALEEDSSVDSFSSGWGGAVGWEWLRACATWLRDAGRPPVQALQQARAPAARSSLNAYRDYLRTRSIGSSPLMRMKNSNLHRTDSTTKKSGRIQKALEKSNKMFMRASHTLEQSTGLAIGPRRALNESHNEEEEEWYGEEREAENTGELCVALMRLAKHEQRALLGLVPLDKLPTLLHNIFADCVSVVVQDIERVGARARRRASRCTSGAGASVCVCASTAGMPLNCANMPLPNAAAQLTKLLHQNLTRTLDDWIEGIKTDSSSAPSDGTVHQLATAALQHLQNLQQYVQVVGPALATEPMYSRAISTLVNTQDQNVTLIAIYMRKVLAQLNVALRSKSENLPESLKAIFRLNNIHYLLQGLQRSNLLEILSLVEPEIEMHYRDIIQEHKAAYLQSWNKLLTHVTLDEPLVKLRDKDRQVLKDKFSNFNRELEECSKMQMTWSVPDSELCESIKRDNKERVLPPYTAFYTNYAHLPFTNKRDKYIKYGPTQVAALLDRFFDVAA